MPVPTLISELSQTPGSNYPAGSESPSTADDYFRTYAAFIATLRDGKGFTTEAAVASAATCDIGAANSLYVEITGTTTVTSLGSNYTGPRFLRFAGSLVLTHNASTLVLPGGANIVTQAGDTAIVVPQSAGWRVVSYERAASLPMVGNGPAFSAARTTDQAVTSAVDTKVQLPSEEFDTAGAFDNATNHRFTPQVAGYYQINAQLYVKGTGITTMIAVIKKNGVEIASTFHTVPSTGDHKLAVSTLVSMNGSTDYIELWGTGTGTGPNFANGSRLSGFLARAA